MELPSEAIILLESPLAFSRPPPTAHSLPTSNTYAIPGIMIRLLLAYNFTRNVFGIILNDFINGTAPPIPALLRYILRARVVLTLISIVCLPCRAFYTHMHTPERMLWDAEAEMAAASGQSRLLSLRRSKRGFLIVKCCIYIVRVLTAFAVLHNNTSVELVIEKVDESEYCHMT